MFERNRCRRAAQSLSWALFGFVALQLGLAWAIECRLGKYRDPFYARKTSSLRRRPTFAQVSNGQPAKLLVMLGSSQTGNDVQGTVLESEFSRRLGEPVVVCNLGVPGAGPVTELLNLAHLTSEGIRPDYLLIEVMPFFLDVHLSEQYLLTDNRLRLADFEWLERVQFPVAKLRRSWWASWALPWYSHRYAILSDWSPNLLPAERQQTWANTADSTGWVPWPNPTPTPGQRRGSLERIRPHYQPILREFQLGGPACCALRLLLDECRKRRLPTALVLLPEGQDFRDFYGPGARPQIAAFLDELRGQYGCPIVNARDWMPDDNLADPHHLTRQGAEAFSRRLAREVLAAFDSSPRARSCQAGK